MIELSPARPWPERAGVANSRTAVVGDEAKRAAGIAARIVQIAVEAHAAAVGDEILHGQAMPRRHDECIRAKRVRHERKRLARATFDRSEDNTSELQSLIRIPYAVFCF